MSCTISGSLKSMDSGGTVTAIDGATLRLRPSRTDFLWTPDAGTTWLPWQKTEDAEAGEEYDVVATTNGSGAFSFVVPWSDSEVLFAVGATSPALAWNIIDEQTGKVYYGPTLEAIVGSSKTIKQLTQLADPNTWRIAGTAWTATPVGAGFKGEVTFTDASAEAAVSFPSPTTSDAYTIYLGLGTDDETALAVYSVGVKSGTKTVNGFTLKLSQTPPTSATVTAWYRVETP